MATEQGVEFTLREWEQVWAHTRHLETMRGQYLGFFFTAVLGSTALVGPRLADDSLRSAGSLITVAALAVGLTLLSGFLYLAVSRLNQVLAYYMRMTIAIREWMLANEAAFDLREYASPPKAPRPWSGASGIAQGVLKAGLVGFPSVLVVVLIRSVELSDLSATTWACAFALAVSLAILAWVVRGSTSPEAGVGASGGSPDG